MTQTLNCPQGHQWPASANGTTPAGDVRCPVCGPAVAFGGGLDTTLCNSDHQPPPGPATAPAVSDGEKTLGPDDDQRTGLQIPTRDTAEAQCELDTTLQKPGEGGSMQGGSVAGPACGAYEI